MQNDEGEFRGYLAGNIECVDRERNERDGFEREMVVLEEQRGFNVTQGVDDSQEIYIWIC